MCAESRFGVSSGGLTYRSSDGSAELRLAGYVQSDMRALDDALPNPPDSLLFRRVRPEFSGTLFHHFDFRVTSDFATSSPLLYDAFVETRFPRFIVRAGKFRAPFGLERLQPATDLTFIERGLPSGLAPNRDWGVQISNDPANHRWTGAIGVFEGASDGALINAGNNRGVDVAARIFATPWRDRPPQAGRFKRALSGLGIGFGVMAGEHHGSALGLYRTFGQATFFPYAERASLAGARVRYSPQAYYYVGRFGLLMEYTRSTQAMAEDGVDTRAYTRVTNSAWQAAGSWVLTGEAKRYRRVDPKQPLFQRHGRGAVEAVARIGGMHLDPVMQVRGLASPESPSTSAREWVVGANWYLTHQVRVSANYGSTRFTSLSGVTPRPTEHVVLGRIQVAF